MEGFMLEVLGRVKGTYGYHIDGEADAVYL